MSSSLRASKKGYIPGDHMNYLQEKQQVIKYLTCNELTYTVLCILKNKMWDIFCLSI